ncbi:MAG: PAS domain-containing sensor histidine kinase [Alphaproteobacteria bacterium]|nr:PAS domain-containing sensor histidine kinase [Alphaproteobacteria bacterium]
MASLLTTPSQSSWSRLAARLRKPHMARRLAVVLAAAATVAGIVTYVVLSGSMQLGAEAEWVLGLLYLDLILLLSLGVIVGHRLVQIVLARRQGSVGSRLHARMVALFSVVAVAPAIIVAIFAVMFLHYGLEAWFSDRVSQALTNSLSVAQSYLEEHKDIIRADAFAMAADIDREAPGLVGDPVRFQRMFDAQAALRSLTEAIIFDGHGQRIARSGLSFGLEIESLPAAGHLEKAAAGKAVILTNDTEDRVRALVRLNSFDDTYLYVGRFVDARVLGYLAQTREVVEEYRSLELRRSGIERAFAIIFGVVALLLLLAAIWVGLLFANGVAGRISQLTQAANLVSAGDLTVRVPETEKRDEIDDLQSTFNRMTDQLSTQRDELVQANSQLDRRRAFTEAVIGGVSSGVIGLDRQGLITLPNPSALDFLESTAEKLVGRPVIAVLPEIAGLLAGAVAAPHTPAMVEQLEFRRTDGHRTLLVRVSAQLDDDDEIASFVVTFEDITELLGAQRTAAWSEIARRIAHEIKNPLTPIRLSAERLKRKYLPQIQSDEDTFKGSIDTIVRQVDTIGTLINEFSAFARMPAPVFNYESACDLVRQAVYLQQGARAEVRFETRLPDDDIQLYCDSRKVAQALTNLVQNAVQSVLQRLANEPDGDERGWVLVKLDATEQFCSIEVHDNGLGLPADEPVGRLTEPYVTKRADGTGLGLAIVKKIMEEHAGTISLSNREGGGASVSLAFPMLPAANNAAAE